MPCWGGHFQPSILIQMQTRINLNCFHRDSLFYLYIFASIFEFGSVGPPYSSLGVEFYFFFCVFLHVWLFSVSVLHINHLQRVVIVASMSNIIHHWDHLDSINNFGSLWPPYNPVLVWWKCSSDLCSLTQVCDVFSQFRTIRIGEVLHRFLACCPQDVSLDRS